MGTARNSRKTGECTNRTLHATIAWIARPLTCAETVKEALSLPISTFECSSSLKDPSTAVTAEGELPNTIDPVESKTISPKDEIPSASRQAEHKIQKPK